jgi:malate synthase
VSAPTPAAVRLTLPLRDRFAEVLTSDALAFVAMLHRRFEPRRRALLQARRDRQARLDSGERPDFAAATAAIRRMDWRIAPLPAALERRRVEITAPVDRKMMINALNSGADSYMADFEDSTTPTWDNIVQGQVNLKDAVRRELELTSGTGKVYRLNPTTAVLQVRPRGWHLDEKHVLIDGERVSASLFDFALAFFHNAKALAADGGGPFYYLPKLESHLEARLWNDVFVAAQDHLAMPRGTIKATVLIETLLAAFEMDEILYELREHSAGLNAGRWDYIFSAIKKLHRDSDFCLAERARLTMEAPFMRSYSLALIEACHRRGAPAIGGMSALIPIKDDPQANARALAGVRHDKSRDARDGFDGGWVAHPALVPIAMQEFAKVLGERPNQWQTRPPRAAAAADLLSFAPQQPITEAGLRNNINVGIHYIGSWLSGTGCVPIHHLMEDAATAEIARSQVWQWAVSRKGILDDGRKVTPALVRTLIAQELPQLDATVGACASAASAYQRAAEIFEQLSLAESFPQFLTLPLYEALG